jgi:hypothetical protein
MAVERAGPYLETLVEPRRYSHAQIRLAATICIALNRGKLIYTMPPELA